MENSKLLLLNEKPLLVLPLLAVKIGLKESMLLQQIHYWNQHNEIVKNNFNDGFYWTFNSYEKWQEQFPFWSIRTIQRAICNLEKLKLVITGNYNKLKIDRTKWYRIDYKALEALGVSPCRQIDVTNKTECPNHLDSLAIPLPETNSEINSENLITTTKIKKVIKFEDISKKLVGFNAIIDAYTNNDVLKTTIINFIKMRKTINKPITDFGLTLSLKDLDESGSTDIQKICNLNYTIKNSYPNIYKNKNAAVKTLNYRKKESIFNNFEQRNYDYDDLEKKLLGRE